ncbi:Dual specificity protein phosphatase cdc14a [Linnemannia schmuckeri]|uniref:protein-tyrosine-phosphatase n=1 Tax=Linnemannia schmuckeri TaxID=64567 RepID=A0A9P5VDR0_9FUNG|nr:Dual specificity protein phosphatase cdc14a [Linnemannia schmuckeri]
MEDQLYFMWTAINPISTRRTTYLTIDSYLQYTSFFSDFGPLDIADVFRFCCLMKERLELAKSQKKVLCLHTKPDDTKRANAAFALCCYMMLLHDMTPEEAYAPVEYIHPSITSFRDAGCGPVTYTLSILDCLRGLRKGLDRGLLRLDRFNVKEYEHYERVSNGDFNWITPFFIAFAGPKDKMKREALLRHEAVRAAAGMSAPSEEGLDETDSSSKCSFSSSSTSSQKSSAESSRSSTPSTQSSTGSDMSIGSTSHSGGSSLSGSAKSQQSQEASQMECPLSISMEASSIDATTSATPPQQQQDDDSGTDISQRAKSKKQRTRLKKSFQSVLSYFSTHNVQCIIRLNDKTYDKAHFTTRGIEHVDMIYPDGTCPPWYIVERFFEVCERVAMDQGGVVAVHCMAGLGRTGTLIGAYLMRHFDMTARETIAFLRLMRPGSVVGPQQNWLAENEWRIRKRDYQYSQGQQPQNIQSLQEERQKEIQDRLLKVQQSHGLTPGRSKSASTEISAGSTMHTPGTDYEQVFSRANSEGLESTWSEVADEVEGGSLTVLDGDDEEDEAETSGFEDMITTEDESMEESNIAEDTDEDEEGGEYGLEWERTHRPSSLQKPSPLRAQHLRRVSIGSLESLTSAFERDSATDDGHEPVDRDVDMSEATATAAAAIAAVTPAEEPSQPSLMEHIGNTDYVIPGQPRKQDLSSLRHHHHHHHHHEQHPQPQASGSSTSSQVRGNTTTHRTHSAHHDHYHQSQDSGQMEQHHHYDDNICTTGGEEKLYGMESFSNPSAFSSATVASPSVTGSTSSYSPASALQGSSMETSSRSDDRGQYGQGPSSGGGSAAIGANELAHVLGTGRGTIAGEGETPTTGETTTTKTAITTGTGNAQGTSRHDRAPLSPSPTVVETNGAPGPSEFEIDINASQPPPSPLTLALPLMGIDNDKVEGVDNRRPNPQQQHYYQHYEHGQDHCCNASAYRDEEKEHEQEEQEDCRHVMAPLPHPPLPHKHIPKSDYHHNHLVHHKQHYHQEVPDSPPSLNSPGGSGRGSAEKEEGSDSGAEGGGRELGQETRAGSVEMCR